MNMSNDGAEFGLSQYRLPHCYELSGKRYKIITDERDYEMHFEGKDLLSFSENGTSMYECLKLAEGLYYVVFGQKVCMAVLDLTQSLCTFVLPELGCIFGAVERRWEPLPDKRHGFTNDVTGTAVRWVFGCGRFVNHVYFRMDRLRCAWSPEEDNYLNIPAKYMSIRDGVYFVYVSGDIPEYVSLPKGCNRLVLLEDYEHMMCVGCTFGEEVRPILLSGYGKKIDVDAKLFEK